MINLEHEDIFDLVKDMMQVDPSDLLPCHRQHLCSGSTVARKFSLQQMCSAVSAAADVAAGERDDERWLR